MSLKYLNYEELHRETDLVPAAMQLVDEVNAADGVSALGEAFLRGIAEAHGHRHVLALDEEQVVGILALDGVSHQDGENPTAEMAVSPTHRRQGVARDMISAAKEGFDLTGPLDVWAHGDLDSAKAMAETVGARRTRELHKMAADANANTEAGAARRKDFKQAACLAESKATDQGLSVLNYTESVEKFGKEHVDLEWVRVNNEAFAWHPEQGGWDVNTLAEARDTDWFDPEGVLMVWATAEASSAGHSEPRMMGFHWTKIPVEQAEVQDGQRAGEVYVVCLADEARGQGLGSAITLLGIGYLLGRGVGTVELYVEGDNEPAVATYRKLGFGIVHTDVVYRGEIL